MLAQTLHNKMGYIKEQQRKIAVASIPIMGQEILISEHIRFSQSSLDNLNLF